MRQMKSVFIMLFCLFMLFGCSVNKMDISDDIYDSYLNYYRSILESDPKNVTSQNFDISCNVTKVDNEMYQYDIVINDAKIAMYDIKVLAVNNEIGAKVDEKQEMPCLGIIDGEKVTMIPGQVDEENGVVEEIKLSFSCDQPSYKFGVMVDYANSTRTVRLREYLSLTSTYTITETGE